MSIGRAVLLMFVVGACGASPPAETGPGPTRGGCTSDAECPSGMACCYPCGVDGCENACMAVDPAQGCPEIP